MIDVNGLCKEHGSLKVLRGVSLRVGRGEVAAIIGPSGGGKSTLLRCINGLEDFQAGSVTVDGMRFTAGRADAAALQAVRRRVGMVFQQFNLFPHLSVLENVMAGPCLAQGARRDAVEPEARALLERVGLAEKADARPGQLSGGQQQRVAHRAGHGGQARGHPVRRADQRPRSGHGRRGAGGDGRSGPGRG